MAKVVARMTICSRVAVLSAAKNKLKSWMTTNGTANAMPPSREWRHMNVMQVLRALLRQAFLAKKLQDEFQCQQTDHCTQRAAENRQCQIHQR